MAIPARTYVTLILGAIMFALGVFLAARPLYAPGRPLTSSIWLDLVFALFFVLRGLMNIRAARRTTARRAAMQEPPGPPAPPPR